jgi:hypothetical protein
MGFLRTISTRRLVGLGAALVVVSASVATLAVTASGGGGALPPAKPLPEAIHDSLAGIDVEGVSARVTFTNNLFPSGALLGSAAPALLSGGSGRLWLTADGRGRLELQSDAGDAQITWRPGTLSVYDSSSDTVYRVALPVSAPRSDTGTVPTVAQISAALARIETDAVLSGAEPVDIAGLPAYAVLLTPKQDGGLLGAVEVSWDAARAVPLRVAVYARGVSSPVLALTANEVTYGPVADDVVDVAPPADAHVVDLGHPTPGAGSGSQSSVTGLDAVRAAAGFPVAAPDTLAGLPRRGVRLVGSGDRRAAVADYGMGPGAVIVVQRPVPPSGSGTGPLASLPTVSVGGHTAHELATPLGTIVTWHSGGVMTVVAGSVPRGVAERAARELA